MKILAINASHRGEKGKTFFFLEKIFQGARDTGAEFQVITLAKLKINRCLACQKCQTEPRRLECVYQEKDDVRWIFDQMAEADRLIFATPVYLMNMTGLMKTFLDRLYSTMNCADGRLSESGLIHHHVNPSISSKPFVTLVLCANLETESWKSVPAYFRTYSRFMNAPQVGVLVRNAADLFGGWEDRSLKKKFPKMQDVVESYEQVGRELAILGHIRRATQRRANQEIIPLPVFWLLKRFKPVKKLIIEQAKQI